MLVSFKNQDALDTFLARCTHLEFNTTDSFSLIEQTTVHVLLSAEPDVLKVLAEAYNYVPDYQI